MGLTRKVNMTGRKNEAGAVSLFSVIFAMLLMSVVTVSFVRLMANDQNQATSNDLAQSAYDSAQAGIEDAKRALVWYQEQCRTNSASCSTWASRITTDECNEALRVTGVVRSTDIAGGSGAGTGEVLVQQSLSGQDDELDQAYTCVTIDLDTPYYVGSLTSGESALIPLRATSGFSEVVIEWFSNDDLSSPSAEVKAPSVTAGRPLLAQENWELDRPALLRTQFMQVGGGFTLDGFDYMNGAGESNANTLFLYPTSNGNTTATLVDRDIRMAQNGSSYPAEPGYTPYQTRCETSIVAGGYACRMRVTLPNAIGGGREDAYVRLTAFYAATHYRVSFSDPTVQFSGVQPEIDSTGRVNDVFRRVKASVNLFDTSFPYPEGAVDVNGSFCKNFGVTDTTYSNNDTSCTP